MKEIRVLEGNVVAPEGMKAAIVASRFNEIIVRKLLDGAADRLVRHGMRVAQNITGGRVPGAFEIPTAAAALAKSGKYDAVICVGAVILGHHPLRLRVQRGFQGHRPDSPVDRHPGALRRPDHGKYRAGAGQGRKQSRQQGLRLRPVRHRNGQSHEAVLI